MSPTKNNSSSQPNEQRLAWIPMSKLHRHPLNPNVMPEDLLEKLAANIAVQGDYPPPVVRPHPDIPGDFQELDGHQRIEVLRRLGHGAVRCYVWPCDDGIALTLIATLNRLHGEDVPARRAALVAELNKTMSTDAMATLLPEDASAIQQLLGMAEFDTEALLADLARKIEQERANGPVLLSFAIRPDEVPEIERAIAMASALLEGPNRRGRALAVICRSFEGGSRARINSAS